MNRTIKKGHFLVVWPPPEFMEWDSEPEEAKKSSVDMNGKDI